MQVANDQVAEIYGITGQNVKRVHRGDDIWVTNTNDLWEACLHNQILGSGLILQPSEQMYGRHGEFLRLLYYPVEVQGSLCRAIAGMNLGLLQSTGITNHPPWIGLLLFKSMVRPVLTYGPWSGQRRRGGGSNKRNDEACGQRFALGPTLDKTSLQDSGHRGQHPGCNHLGARFLMRHFNRGYTRLLSAYAEETPQHSGLVRVEGPLEFLLSCLRPPIRHRLSDGSWTTLRLHPVVTTVNALHDLKDPPTYRSPFPGLLQCLTPISPLWTL